MSIQRTDGTHQCGGFIINSEWVVTSAQCFSPRRGAASLQVVAGASRLSEPQSGQMRAIAQAIEAPGYVIRRPNLGNDAALLRLAMPLDLSSPNVSAIRYATANDALLEEPGRQATVAGWGDLEHRGDLSDVLQLATVTLLPLQDAINAYDALDSSRARRGTRPKIRQDQLAAAAPGTDACKHDGGGPLVVRDPRTGDNVAIGITSWGEGCADPQFPGMYSRVSSFSRWIRDTATSTMTITSPIDKLVSGTVRISADVSSALAHVFFELPDGTTQQLDAAPWEFDWQSEAAADGVAFIRAWFIGENGLPSETLEREIFIANHARCRDFSERAWGLPVRYTAHEGPIVDTPIHSNIQGNIREVRMSVDIESASEQMADLNVTLMTPSGRNLDLRSLGTVSPGGLVLDSHLVSDLQGEPAGGQWNLRVAYDGPSTRHVVTVRDWSLEIASCSSPVTCQESAATFVPRAPTSLQSSIPLQGDAAFGFQLKDTRKLVCGLTTSLEGRLDYVFAVKTEDGRAWGTRRTSTAVSEERPVAAGSTIQIARVGTSIEFRVDGAVLATEAVFRPQEAFAPLYAVCTELEPGAGIIGAYVRTCSGQPENCTDGIDNNGDGFTDCQDKACRGEAPAASAALSVCGDTCFDLATDPLNCGQCGIDCGDNSLCASGVCHACPVGSSLCDDTCVDLTSDVNNCGGCGVQCPNTPGVTCVDSACVAACEPSPMGPNALSGSTVGGVPHTPSCADSSSPARTFLWTAPIAGQYTFNTRRGRSNDFDTVLTVSDDTTGTELACNDDGFPAGDSSRVEIGLEACQTVRVTVQGYRDAVGDFDVGINCW